MYRDFYGFGEDPFRLTPDARFCFHHRSFSKARAYFRYALDHGEGFVVVTGRPGTGKTMLIDDLLADLNRSGLLTVRIESAQIQADDLMRRIAYGFGLDPQGQDQATILHRLERHLESRLRSGERALLIVDEAQVLPIDALEALRLLTNLRPRGDTLIQIFLVGQEALRNVIRSPELEQLHQRILCACHLEPLTARETRDYIAYRLERAGWHGDPLIEGPAVVSVHRATLGVPRLINKFMDRLLLHASIEGLHRLAATDAEIVLRELAVELLFADRPADAETDGDGEVDYGGLDDIEVPSYFTTPEASVGTDALADPMASQLRELFSPDGAVMSSDRGAEPGPLASPGPRLFSGDVSDPSESSPLAASDPRRRGHESEALFGTTTEPLSPLPIFRFDASPAQAAEHEDTGGRVDRGRESALSTAGRTGAVSMGEHGFTNPGQGGGLPPGRTRPGSYRWVWAVALLLVLTGGLFVLSSEEAAKRVSEQVPRLRLWLGSIVPWDESLRSSPSHDAESTALEDVQAPRSRSSDADVSAGVPDRPADDAAEMESVGDSTASPEDTAGSSSSEGPIGPPTGGMPGPSRGPAQEPTGSSRAVPEEAEPDPDPEVPRATIGMDFPREQPASSSSSVADEPAVNDPLERAIDRESPPADPASPSAAAQGSPSSPVGTTAASEPVAQTASSWSDIATEVAALGLASVDSLDGNRIRLRESIPFEFDSIAIPRGSMIWLERLSDMLIRYPAVSVQVVGHTDDVGDPAYNRFLSLQRAEALAKHLIEKGVSPERIETDGRGEDEPVVWPDNGSPTSAERLLNRRIEMTLLIPNEHSE